jgi:cytochrome c oxidase subunit 2
MTVKVPYSYLLLLLVAVVAGWIFWHKPAGQSPASSAPSPKAEQKSEQVGKVATIEMTAERYSFSPNPVRVPLGSKVRLKIYSKDVDHGFSLPDFGVNAYLKARQTTEVEFVANRRGRFSFLCSVVCGPGHSEMRGNLIVE